MGKLKILFYMLGVTVFLLSVCLMPVLLVVLALAVFNTLWVKIVLCFLALVWLTLFRPWYIFRDKEKFKAFMSDMKTALICLFS